MESLDGDFIARINNLEDNNNKEQLRKEYYATSNTHQRNYIVSALVFITNARYQDVMDSLS